MNNYYISTLLKELRIDYNYTIQNVANKLGVSKAAVSKWENGDDITTEHLYDLAKLYNVTFSELYNGKLNNENSNNYWKRNYDLSNYEVNENIDNKNLDNLKNLFEHCVMVKQRFYELLPKWAKNELNNNQLEELNFIKKYFKFDKKYYLHIKYGTQQSTFINEKIEKEFVNEILDNISSLDDKNYLWEITKLYNFIFDYKSDIICESGNLKALEYMLTSFSQIEKDLILYANYHIKEEKEIDSPFGGKSKQLSERNRTIEEIENIPYFKIIINSGANMLYQYKSPNEIWDKEMFERVEGEVVIATEDIYNKYDFYNFAGQNYVPMLSNWKLFSYNDYLDFIDKDTTNYFKDIVNLKDTNPLKYFSNLVTRNSL